MNMTPAEIRQQVADDWAVESAKALAAQSMHALVGRAVTTIHVDEHQTLLSFGHPDGTTTSYRVYGDCCSETWFADFTGVHALLGCVVTASSAVDLPSIDDGRTRQDTDVFYGVRLHTSRGTADIVYRNSSNGYYGGSIALHIGPIPRGMLPIVDDWTA